MSADDTPRGIAALAAWWRDASRRRKLASLAIALGIEGLILLLLLTLGAQIAGDEAGKEAVSTFKAMEFAAPPEPEAEAETKQPVPPNPADTPETDQPLQQSPIRPSPLLLNPAPAPQPPPAEAAPPQPRPSPSPQPATPPKIGARIRPDNGSYGPADTGNPRSAGDSERVGMMPNGEPLFAARWYRQPSETEMAGYLSTANGSGYAVIACKTVAGYYVEDCQLLSEGPPGSQMGRAVLAASWQFRVRPARIGGQEQFGSWVQIRINYSVQRERR